VGLKVEFRMKKRNIHFMFVSLSYRVIIKGKTVCFLCAFVDKYFAVVDV
jgi:hypothetical protein